MRRTRRSREAGIALVLALLSLMLLTFLGLTLATTTSTELQIANNYRWSQQAYYNAEAGIEVGRRVLATVDWSTVLYPPRFFTPDTGATVAGPGWDGVSAPTMDAEKSSTPTSRNYENWSCDVRSNGAGYGRLLVDGANTYIDQTTASGQRLDGAFTLWVRRPLVPRRDGSFEDYVGNDVLILTAEGVAPYSDASGVGTALGRQNRAARTIEVQFGSTATASTCATLGGQVGGGPGGAGFGGCVPVNAASLQNSLGLASAPAESETTK
jgi:hypothetical protein